jgi:uncharacterized OsmC-like protein
VIRRRPPAPSVYLLDVLAEQGGRTQARGALWDGVLNATPDDEADGPSPVEALLAGVAACFVRNLRWVADGVHVEFARIALHIAAQRDDDPPALSAIRMEIDLATDAPADRVVSVVERALRSGTITCTVARAVPLDIVVRINGATALISPPVWDGGLAKTSRQRDRLGDDANPMTLGPRRCEPLGDGSAAHHAPKRSLART